MQQKSTANAQFSNYKQVNNLQNFFAAFQQKLSLEEVDEILERKAVKRYIAKIEKQDGALKGGQNSKVQI